MLIFILKEIESSTETNSYCTIMTDNMSNDIVTIFSQNAYLYAFGKAEFWEILSQDETHLTWTIGMEHIESSCEHIVRYLLKHNITISSIEITNTIMWINNYQRVLDTLHELDCAYEFINEEIWSIYNPQSTENGNSIN